MQRAPISTDRPHCRPKTLDVDRRRQPQQPVSRPGAQSAGDATFGIGRDGRQVITAVTDPAQQPTCAGQRGPPGLVPVGEPDDLAAAPARRSAGASRPRGAAAPKITRRRAEADEAAQPLGRRRAASAAAAARRGPPGSRDRRSDSRPPRLGLTRTPPRQLQQRADLVDERLDAADPGREVVGDDQGRSARQPLGQPLQVAPPAACQCLPLTPEDLAACLVQGRPWSSAA